MDTSKPALENYVEDIFGGRFTVVSTNKTVGTTAAEVVKNNFDRMALILVNQSTNALSIGFDNTITNGNGFVLNANGGGMILNAVQDLVLPGWNYYAIGSQASQSLQVFEVLRFWGS